MCPLGEGRTLPTRGLEGRDGPRSVIAVVVTHNSAAIIEACLDSIARNMSDEPGLSVIVVDNGSSDDTVSKAHGHRIRSRVLVQENLGYAAGINTGIATVDDDNSHIFVLNPDVRLDEGCVKLLADGVEDHGTGIAVPRMVDGDGHLLLSLRREPTILRAFGEAVLGGTRTARLPALGEVIANPAAYDQPTIADWATGAAMLISASCRHAVGAWDERYFLYSEETDYALRARDMGFALRLVPEASATHLGGESQISARLWSLLTINRIRFQRRRKGVLQAIPYALAVTLSAGLRAAAGQLKARAVLGALARPTLGDPDLQRAMERSPDYLLFAGLDWWYHSRAHSDFQLLQRVARTRDVLVVNSIGMRMPTPGRTAGSTRRIMRKIASATRLMRKPVRGLFGFNVITPLLLPIYGSPAGRALNAILIGIQVRVAAAFAGVSDPIIVASLPTAVDVIDRLPHRCVVYNRSDKHSEFVEADQGVIRSLEERMLRESDLVLYSSHVLMEEDRPLAEGRQLFLDHGVDLDHFDPERHQREPDDLRDIARPRVGFFGGLDDYLVDFELIRATARALPHAHVVLIGDKYCSNEEIEQLVALPNLKWLGFRPYEQIPAYGTGFDVAIMPWQDNDWVRRANPIKLKEYLALGLPVVSVDFPELARYADVVSVAASPEEFIEKVAAALEDGGPGTPSSRRAAVADASWDRRAQELMAAVETLGGR
jgi:GT2 family glycosyltransferase/glycosyltransferase involved in cell wall biosynthesis